MSSSSQTPLYHYTTCHSSLKSHAATILIYVSLSLWTLPFIMVSINSMTRAPRWEQHYKQLLKDYVSLRPNSSKKTYVCLSVCPEPQNGDMWLLLSINLGVFFLCAVGFCVTVSICSDPQNAVLWLLLSINLYVFFPVWLSVLCGTKHNVA